MTNTAPTPGALELSARDAGTWTHLFGNRLPLLTAEQGNELRRAGKLGQRLLNIEGQAAWDLFEAERRAIIATANLVHEAQEVTKRLAEGAWVNGVWVTDAVAELTEILTERQDAIDAILANRQLITFLLAEQGSGDPAGSHTRGADR